MDNSGENIISKEKQKIIDDINEFGFHIVLIEENDYLPRFAYTIGLTKTYQHPELIVFGLNADVIFDLLNGVGDNIKSGVKYLPNKDYENIISNFPLKFLEVKKEHYQDYLGYAGWFYNNIDFETFQIIWPDKKAIFPWEEGFNENWKFKQPILDRNTDFKFYEERNLGVFTTEEILNGRPILWVYHNEDGDWQFHSDENPKIENSKIVTLESLVHQDPTLNEIYFLNFGESAKRKTTDSDWETF